VVKGRILIAVMVLVSAWSLWAFAQQRHQPGGHTGPMQPGRSMGAPPRALPAHPTPPAPHPTESAEMAEKHEEEGPPAAINWADFGSSTPPFLAMFVNFGILVAGYYLLGRKPIAAALQSRRDSIAKEIEEAARMRKEAEARAETYQAKLAHLEEEMKGAREALVRAGEAERDRIVVEAEAKAERMRKDAEFLVEQEMKQIRQDLWRDTVEVAVTAAEDLLKKRVTDADQERIADDYLADLGGKRFAPGTAAGTQESTT
jgi:F-type H+-transporting ATPase subunit b